MLEFLILYFVFGLGFASGMMLAVGQFDMNFVLFLFFWPILLPIHLIVEIRG